MTIQSPRRRSTIALLAATLALPTLSLSAQGLGDKPIRLIVPLTAGSTVDAVARVMANQYAKTAGRAVMVENLVGAGGVTGTTQLVRAPKDGSTFGMVSSNHVINPSIYKSVPFDAITDITPISVIGTVPLVLVAHPSLPAKDLKELLALAKAKPGELNYGSAGNGSSLHLAGEMLKAEAAIDIRHVPYRGTGPLTNDLLGGQVQLGFVSVTAVAAHVKAGKLRAIGLSTAKRSAVLPDVPTLAEQGLVNYSFDSWIAVIGPAGLPASVVDKLHSDTKTALSTKEAQEALSAQGIMLIGSSPEAATQFFKTELEKHAKLVKQSGARLE
ncbi:tripartite tricarboxylate transporter substrate binding protein [Noviherbaspirillum saxi]|uniref:Tripartite tricarboxylate transporter substrate binding protein n=1 Tax=Noviherbaspirillum saxi TaxID=2320863 RepID=A0A3A3FYC7_9BURK|nr:tripartite tricarboxylate transporter substrate binding protein [Noviherbaspirillum saxi]RJF92089.1 tripartite tricarboxylate transporter substrate binding protein [Noviherbaspirillum saxi]